MPALPAFIVSQEALLPLKTHVQQAALVRLLLCRLQLVLGNALLATMVQLLGLLLQHAPARAR